MNDNLKMKWNEWLAQHTHTHTIYTYTCPGDNCIKLHIIADVMCEWMVKLSLHLFLSFLSMAKRTFRNCSRFALLICSLFFWLFFFIIWSVHVSQQQKNETFAKTNKKWFASIRENWENKKRLGILLEIKINTIIYTFSIYIHNYYAIYFNTYELLWFFCFHFYLLINKFFLFSFFLLSFQFLLIFSFVSAR